jgi:hypothetical protein
MRGVIAVSTLETAIGIVSVVILLAMVVAVPYGRRPARALPDEVCVQIARLPERRKNQHVVDLHLRDGRVVRKVWIAWGRYPALIGGRMLMGRYRPDDVVAALAHESESAPGAENE